MFSVCEDMLPDPARPAAEEETGRDDDDPRLQEKRRHHALRRAALIQASVCRAACGNEPSRPALPLAVFFPFFFDRYAVSAQTDEAVSVLSGRQTARFATVIPGGVGHCPGADGTGDQRLYGCCSHRRGWRSHHGRAIRALLSTSALQCPTPVAVLPAQSGRVGRPCLGNAACLQSILPGVRGAPARSLDNGGVDRPRPWPDSPVP